MVGSIAFGLSAIGSFVLPTTGEPASVWLTNMGTFVGALCFLAGAVLLLYERTEAARLGEVRRADCRARRRGTLPADPERRGTDGDQHEPDAEEQFSRACSKGSERRCRASRCCSRFLLVLPFQNGFGKLDAFEKRLYAVAFGAAGIALILLIAPSVHQRVRTPFTGVPRRQCAPREGGRVPRSGRERRRRRSRWSRRPGWRCRSCTATALAVVFARRDRVARRVVVVLDPAR